MKQKLNQIVQFQVKKDKKVGTYTVDFLIGGTQMKKRYLKPEYLAEVKKIDLLTYLSNYEPNELVKLSKNDYVTVTHGSLHISNGMWTWWARGIGGKSALDYLIKVEGMDFIDAAFLIHDCITNVPPTIKEVSRKISTNQTFKLPPCAMNNDVVIDYLCNERCIAREIVEYYIYYGMIYESENHEVVFVGKDEHNIDRFASIRATDFDIKKDVFGSNKQYSFSLKGFDSEVLHVFESVIDLMSYQTIQRNRNIKWAKDYYLSLGGASIVGEQISSSTVPISLIHFLKNNPKIKQIRVHTDNDQAGYDTYSKIKYHLQNKYEVIDERPNRYKDFNEVIQKKPLSNDINCIPCIKIVK